MTILIRMLNTPLDLRLVDHVRSALAGALERFASRVRDVRVVIEDVHGLRGDHDDHEKEVRIVVVGSEGLGTISVGAVDADVEVAIARALERVERCLGRALERERTRSLKAS